MFIQRRKADFDVVVLGGGPGGSTVASLIAGRGHRVLLLESETFPRHQIGESLLPATVHGICRLLGTTEELKHQNFPVKRGGTFLWGRNEAPWTFTFSSRLDNPTGTAYQVERMKFDAILLNNARSCGVDVREQHAGTDLLVENGRVVGVGYSDSSGNRGSVTARYVVDSCGHRSSMHKHCGTRVFSKFFQNLALYGYFENGRRLPAPNSGNILSVAFRDGWFWYIPLSDTLTSVGAVISRESADEIQAGPERAMNGFIERTPMIRDYLAAAKRVTAGPYGHYRVRKDYSYCNTRFWSPGLLLVGDAGCFIDPVFSSGVHLATFSALLAARSINTCLESDSIAEDVCLGEFERRYRREFGNFYQFLVGFYDMQVDEASYFWRARKIVNTEEQDNVAFVRLVAGLSDLEEPIFGSGQDFFKSRRGFGEWFERKVSSGETGLVLPPRTAAATTPSQFEPEIFMQGFTAEIAELQLQARFGSKTVRSKPLFEHNLIASPDGLQWVVA